MFTKMFSKLIQATDWEEMSFSVRNKHVVVRLFLSVFSIYKYINCFDHIYTYIYISIAIKYACYILEYLCNCIQ